MNGVRLGLGQHRSRSAPASCRFMYEELEELIAIIFPFHLLITVMHLYPLLVHN